MGLCLGIVWISHELLKDTPPSRGNSRRPGMLKLTDMGRYPTAIGQSLLRVSENESQMRQPRQSHHPGIDCVNETRAPVPHRIIEGERCLKCVAALGKSAVLTQG